MNLRHRIAAWLDPEAAVAKEFCEAEGILRLMKKGYRPYGVSFKLDYVVRMKPLDERFADFKDRLSAALKRHGMTA